MFRLSRTQYLPIGIDVGSDSVKLMQLQIVGDELSVACAAREPMPMTAGEDVHTRNRIALEVIRKALQDNDFHGRKVVMPLPREMVHLKNLRMPIMPAADTAAALQFEAKSLFPFDTDSATLEYLHAGEVRQGSEARQEIMVIAAKNSELEHYVEHLHSGGLLVESLDYEPCAIYRSIERFMRRKEDEQDVHVLVDVGLRRTQVIIGRGREIALIKPVEVGGMAMREAVSRKLGITLEETVALRQRLASASPEAVVGRDAVRESVEDTLRPIMENLAREIALCLRYYSVTFRGSRPLSVRMIGGEGNDAQLIRIASGALSIPVAAWRAIENVDYTAMRIALRRGQMSEWSVAMGLSLKGTSRHFAGREGRARSGSPSLDASNVATAQVPNSSVGARSVTSAVEVAGA